LVTFVHVKKLAAVTAEQIAAGAAAKKAAPKKQLKKQLNKLKEPLL
jgi:hypothetical protein